MVNIKIEKLHPHAVIPSYANRGDAGLDLTAVSVKEVHKEGYGYYEYGTGLAIEIPPGYVGLIFPRSSISKKGQFLANSTGVIDSGYRGEIKLRFKTIPETDIYKPLDRVGQLIIMPYPEVSFTEVNSLEESERGSKGFGSTGN